MATASGTREVPFARQSVWQALTAITPYCPVCDVSYVFSGDVGEGANAPMGQGTRFVCVSGRLDGGPPPTDAVAGEVVEWVVQERIGTRLELASESWHTRIELTDTRRDSTQVTVTVTRDPKGGSRLLHVLQRRGMQRLVQQTVDSELAKLPEHVDRLSEDRRVRIPLEQGSSSVEQEEIGRVLHLRGEVDARTVKQLQGRLETLTVDAIDVRELAYIDSTAFPPLLRWARRVSRAGGRAVVRGDNQYFDEMLAVMGLTSVFIWRT